MSWSEIGSVERSSSLAFRFSNFSFFFSSEADGFFLNFSGLASLSYMCFISAYSDQSAAAALAAAPKSTYYCT